MAIEIEQVKPQHREMLCRFFSILAAVGCERYFHPHPLTQEGARELASYCGQDLYYILVDRDEILGYGMLRGWDEGFEVPSLGIAILPEAQGRGLGRLLMDFLRAAAIFRGATRIRLRVHPENLAAAKLYRSLGYGLQAEPCGSSLLGYLDLPRPERRRPPASPQGARADAS